MTKTKSALLLIVFSIMILALTVVFIVGVTNYCDNIIATATLNHDAYTYTQMSRMRTIVPLILGSIGIVGVYCVCSMLSPGSERQEK